MSELSGKVEDGVQVHDCAQVDVHAWAMIVLADYPTKCVLQNLPKKTAVDYPSTLAVDYPSTLEVDYPSTRAVDYPSARAVDYPSTREVDYPSYKFARK